MAYIAEISTLNTTIDFIGSNYYHLEDAGVIIHPVDEKINWTSSPDGDVPANVYQEGRKVEIIISVLDTTRYNVWTRISTIEDLLRRATDYYLAGGRAADRTEFKFAFDQGTPSYFEVLYGKIKLPKDIMSVNQVLQDAVDGYYKIKNITIELLCKPRITKYSPVDGTPEAVSLTNCHGNNITTGIQVDNTWDSSYCHYVSFGNLQGDMPLPTIMKIKYNGSAYGSVGKVFIGSTIKQYTSAPDYIWELENTNAYTSYFGGITHSGQTNSHYSDGEAELVTLPANETVQPICYQTQGTIKEGIFRAFLISGSTTFPESTAWQLRLSQVQTGTSNLVGKTIYGERVVPIGYHSRTDTSYIVDLGMFILPPTLQGLPDIIGAGEQSKWLATLYGSSTSGSTQQVSLDRLFFMPIDKGFRVLDLHSTPLGYYTIQDQIIDDGWRGFAYMEDDSASHYYQDNVDAFFSPIFLEPNRLNCKIFFLFEDYGFGPADRMAPRDMGATVTVYYLPSYKHSVY